MLPQCKVKVASGVPVRRPKRIMLQLCKSLPKPMLWLPLGQPCKGCVGLP